MPMDKLNVHAGDDLPPMYAQLIDQYNDNFIDLSPSTTSVTVKFRLKGDDTVLETVTCTKWGGGSTGWVYWDWPTDALDVDPGTYEWELSVDFNGRIQTANAYAWENYPNDTSRSLRVRVREDF